jgi:2-keto-4-pentenoate hydratase
VTGPTGSTGDFSAAQNINAQTASYTLALSDAGKLVTLATGSGSMLLTIPTNASAAFAVGTHVDLARLGEAAVSVTGATGVTVNATPGNKLRARYSTATAIHYETDVWLLTGDIAS